MRTLFCRFAAFLLVAGPLAAQTALIPEKVDSNLWVKVKTGGHSEFLVILAEQADVRAAARFRSKADKGRYVYETLLETAERTQTPVREVLRRAGAPVQSFWIVNAVWSVGSADLILRLADMPEVARVEDNPVWHLSLPPQPEITATQRLLTPMSWGLSKINADDVWNMGYTGTGVVVGGHDTGYEWQHPALKEKYRGWDGSTADHNYNWHDAIHDTINQGANSCGLNLMAPCDDNFHGTHTMGTMAGGVSNDSVIGVAPDAKWIGCRNMEEGDGKPSTYIECFQWFVAPTNLANTGADPAMSPDVINNSWGCPLSEGCNSTNFATMDAVVTNVRASGILVVTSAGNNGSLGCSSVNDPPSIYGASFAVGATNSSDNIAGFSSRGPVNVYGNLMKPNISAPGVSILSCYGYNNNPASYTYVNLQGTSMAGPHVAGVAALIMSARPDLKGQVDVLETLLKNTAVPRYATPPFCGTDTGTSHPNNVYGWGRVDALAAVAAALALPVELTAFTAEAYRNDALLHWTTASESGCSYFEVQRSDDGSSWTPVGSVPCSVASHGVKNYDFTDVAPGQGLHYYRLKQVDFSGAFAFSAIVAIRFGDTRVRLHVSAHPALQTAFLEVDGGASGEQWQVTVLSADGRTMQTAAMEQMLSLRLPNLAHGVYAVLLRDGRGRVVAVEKMVW